ncbi:Ribokinase-like protein [Cylindrobasidium torrendii FP15055 ss-10]|uniref:Ribokinase n=1 Tax=Cylindrobasidium torrendii FP15055 ss-10 TaxID=1314674 RepID=A0A0D7AS82_9AGAR|nr:Ribokinase-like protein [Cylindrobasidium torrendii FP15055 ss-10]
MPNRCLVRGSINIDEFFHVHDIVRPGETISSSGLEKRAGGKGANQAVAVARAGAAVDLVAAVGNDGLWVRELLMRSQVNVDSVAVVDDSTGRAIIQLSQEGENSIILFKGANYSAVHKENPPTMHPEVTHILLQNEIPFADTLAQLESSSHPSLPRPIATIFNPSPMPTAEELRILPWKNLTWLVVNEGEAEDLSAALTFDSSIVRPPPNDAPYASMSAYPVVMRLAQCIPTTNIVCTLGGAGVLAHVPALEGAPVYLPAAVLEAVRDTTGAGDCFTGYMVDGLMKLGEAALTRESLTAILKRSVQAAGMCVERRGAMESIPAGHEVDARLALR